MLIGQGGAVISRYLPKEETVLHRHHRRRFGPKIFAPTKDAPRLQGTPVDEIPQKRKIGKIYEGK